MDIAFCMDQGPRASLEDYTTAVTHHVDGVGPITIATVCDGVGGNARGEVASNLAASQVIETLIAYFNAAARTRPTPEAVLAWLTNAFARANAAILQQADAEPACRGMATTAVCAVIVDSTLYVAWAGDSRCYVVGEQAARQLTRDHSDVVDLIEAGIIDADEAHDHPAAHRINRCLGRPDRATPDVTTYRLQSEEVVVLTTDGLTDVLTNDDIARTVRECRNGHPSFFRLPERLVQRALLAGTGDNVSVLCCNYQPAANRASRSSEQTMTEACSVRRAEALRRLYQEKQDGKAVQHGLFD